MGAQYLYRRDSGIYFIRLCVPTRLKQAVGKGEIHRSTGCRDLRLAKIVAAEMAGHWHRAIEAVQVMDPQKIKAGSVSLLGGGLVALHMAATELGAEVADLARRLADRGAHFYVEARDWAGWALDSIYDNAEYEHDELGRAVMVIPPCDGSPCKFGGRLRIRHTEEALQAAAGEAQVCQFLVWPSSERGFVVDLPGRAITVGELQVEREQVESLRVTLSSQLATGEATTTRVPDPTQGMRFSELAEQFLLRKKPFWKTDQLERKTDQCKAFQDLMGDPPLARITRPMMREFSDKLARVPADRDKVRRRFDRPEAGFRELIELADTHTLPRITSDTYRRFLDGISEVFAWAVKETYVSTNPATGLGMEILKGAGAPKKRAQDQRDAFSDDDLGAIFAAEWFARGVGRKTPQGTYHSYRPLYYWLPLLALYCGGRLNELAQLYLDDIVNHDGVWCVDFNLDADDKLVADDAEHEAAGEKRLKTFNAQRLVPVHERLIELGLLEYVDALRRAGHRRLFPELHFDRRKGYGKAAGNWFNERFLGRRIRIDRNGRKTFHSFRHNFATALGAASVPLPVKSDLMGHSRSVALVEARYDKGAELTKLQQYINAIQYTLPPIAPFVISDGVAAVRDALRLKASHTKRQTDGGGPAT